MNNKDPETDTGFKSEDQQGRALKKKMQERPFYLYQGSDESSDPQAASTALCLH